MLNASGRPVWFVGDLDDPWVESIADALAAGTRRVSADADWYEVLAPGLTTPATLVIHRPVLTTLDAERLARLRRDRVGPLRVVLCVGPHVRYADLQRWGSLVDVVLPEATARETVARHVREGQGNNGPACGEAQAVEARPNDTAAIRPRVAIISRNYELRLALSEACQVAGYVVQSAADWSLVAPGCLLIWDVPVLEPDWQVQLARYSRSARVVVLLGFADRALVTQSRVHGASACLELPCDPADLIEVLDRLALMRPDAGHEAPPAPLLSRRGTRPVAEPGRDTYN